MSGKRLWDKGKSIDKEVHSFTIGSDPIIDKEILEWDILASAAHAIMLGDQGLISKEDQAKLIKALSEAYPLAQSRSFEIPYELEDCHTALESYLVEKCGDAGKRIHLGRSRNDQVLVASRLYLRNANLELGAKLLMLAETCKDRAKPLLGLQLPGHTHFQQAMPASAGMWLLAISEAALELAEESFSLNHTLSKNPLGVGSGFGSPLKIDREKTTNLLKFERTQRNPINTQNSRGKYETKLLRLLSDVAGLIEKHSFDLILYSMQEINFVKLPEEFTTGSSIMPQKRNPDVLELLRGNASLIRSKQFESEMLTSKLPSHYHRDFQLTKEPLIQAFSLSKTLLNIFLAVIEKITFNEEVLKKSKTPELYATYEAFRLVGSGMPFRDAYRETAKKLENNQIDVEDLSKDFDSIQKNLERELTTEENELKDLSLKFVSEINKLETLKKDLLNS